MPFVHTSKNDSTYDGIVIGSGIRRGWAAKELYDHELESLVVGRGRAVKHVRRHAKPVVVIYGDHARAANYAAVELRKGNL